MSFGILCDGGRQYVPLFFSFSLFWRQQLSLSGATFGHTDYYIVHGDLVSVMCSLFLIFIASLSDVAATYPRCRVDAARLSLYTPPIIWWQARVRTEKR